MTSARKLSWNLSPRQRGRSTRVAAAGASTDRGWSILEPAGTTSCGRVEGYAMKRAGGEAAAAKRRRRAWHRDAEAEAALVNQGEPTSVDPLVVQQRPRWRLRSSVARKRASATAARPGEHLSPVAGPADDRSRATGGSHCKACDLYKRGTQTVFGEGRPRAQIMLVRRAPGMPRTCRAPLRRACGKLLDRGLERWNRSPDGVTSRMS